jgi:hypothetical protein
MTEQDLIEKLRKIERLFSGASTEGERDAAESALNRIRERLKSVEKIEKPEEYKFSLSDQWNRKLFLALLRRYGIRPYRLPRQRYTTVMANVPKSFVDNTLWPEYLELSGVLESYINEITDKVIRNNIFEDSSEASVVEESKRLSG